MDGSQVRTEQTVSRGALAALALAMLLASLGISVATVAQPALAAGFAAPLPHVQWVVLVYLLAVTVAIVPAGRLGDLLGGRRVLAAALWLFAAASLAAALAPGLGWLIAARGVQGLAAAALMALSAAMVREAVAPERTGAAMGLLGTMSAVGTALGPSLGGLMISGAGWRAAFAVLLPLALVALTLVLRCLPAREARTGGGRLDLPGMAILGGSLAAYAVAMTAGIWPLLGLAAVGAVLFIAVESRSRAPLVPVGALANGALAVSLALNVIVAKVMMATLVVGPFFLAFGLGLDEALVGLVMAVGPGTAALAGVPAGRITDRFGADRVLVFGLVQTTAGLAGLALLPVAFGWPGYVLALVLLTPGFQMFLAANNTGAMKAARDDRRGMVSGLLGLARNLGFVTGASAMGAVFAAAARTPEIASAAPEAVTRALTVTFLTTAGLTALALAVAAYRQARP